MFGVAPQSPPDCPPQSSVQRTITVSSFRLRFAFIALPAATCVLRPLAAAQRRNDAAKADQDREASDEAERERPSRNALGSGSVEPWAWCYKRY